jgi:predicted ATPase
LTAVTDLVAGSRLVTLTGPGGSGKTRLAVAAADRLLPRFDDGVFFVPLAPLQEPERVPSAVALALGLREAPDRPALDVVRDHLVDKRLLLVADNFEHLVPATPVVGDLLEAAPGLSVLATSRVLLRVYGEQEYSVPPLPVPEARIGSEAIAANPCVKLFAERASAVRPDFRLTDQNLPIVAEICRRVDGLPLAVELAAARIRILSPAELLGRLESRLSTLTGGARDLPERQRTLRATIDWSHELLEPEERRLFARLSVFAGGWSREAAEAICASDLSIDVLDGLESLLDKSLVRREDMPDDQLRFDMLETIREYAKERLEEDGDAVRVRRLHASYYRNLAEAAEPDLTGPESGRWIEILTRETPNLRMALQWALDSGETSDLEEGLFTAGALWRYWQLTGSLREAAEWLDRLLAHPASAAPTAARAKALRGDGGIEYWRNDMAKSRQLYEQSVAIYRGLDDKAGLAAALNDLAYLPMLAGELELARSMFGEARQLFEAAGDQWQAALAQFNLASLSFFTGDHAEARRLMDTALPVFRARGERFWLIEAVTGLGQLDQLEGNIEGARRNFAESLQLALDSAMLPSIAMVLDPLSNLESEAGDHERAVKLWAASQAIKEKVGGGAPSEMMQAVDPSPAAIEALGAEAVAEAWKAGQSMSPEEAVAYAVGSSQPVKRAVTASRR